MRSSGQARPETPVLFPSLRQAPVHHSPLYRRCGNRRHLWLMLPLLKSLRPAGYLAPPHHLCSLAFLRCCRVGTNSVTPINAFAASVEGLFPQMRLITETSPGSSAGAFLALLPRFPSLFQGRQALVSLSLDLWADARLAPGIRDAAKHVLPRTRALICFSPPTSRGRIVQAAAPVTSNERLPCLNPYVRHTPWGRRSRSFAVLRALPGASSARASVRSHPRPRAPATSPRSGW
jgi:hypothetical protein